MFYMGGGAKGFFPSLFTFFPTEELGNAVNVIRIFLKVA